MPSGSDAAVTPALTSTSPSTIAAASSTSPTSTITSTSTTASPTTTTTSGTTSTSSTSSTATTSASFPTTSAQSPSLTSPSALPSQTVISSGGSVQTITQVVTPTVTTTPTPQNQSSSSGSFFSNKKAVIGVFTVVGLVVLAIIIALVINAIRRRRARKFDRDVAEAAAEAAASSRSPFEDYSYTNTGGNGGGGGGSGGGGYGYSENSHGTYQLPALQPNDAYGMSEMSQYDPYAAGAASLAAASGIDRSRSRKESEPGTPGIAGVGARGLAREPSRRAPYHAFAGPGLQPHELQTNGGTIRSQRGTNADVFEAAGLGASTATPPDGNVTRRPSETTQHTHFSGRSQFGSMNGHNPTSLQPGYTVDSYYPQRHDSLSPDPFAAGYPPVMSVSTTVHNPHDTTALPSPSGQQSDHNEDDTELGSSAGLRSEEQRMSYQDDTDYSQGNRILRVANE